LGQLGLMVYLLVYFPIFYLLILFIIYAFLGNFWEDFLSSVKLSLHNNFF
jgi:uncharacterized membrane protein